MRLIRKLIAAITIGMASWAPALAQVVDQQNLPTDGWVNTNAAGIVWQQEVTAGIDGRLASVELFFGGDRPVSAVAQPFRFFINRGSGWQTDGDDFSWVVDPPLEGTTVIDVAVAAFDLSAGQTFVFGVEGLGPDNGCCNLRATDPGTYAGGRLFTDPGNEYLGWDLAFVTRMIATPIPEPATLWQLMMGLMLLGGYAGIRRDRGFGPR